MRHTPLGKSSPAVNTGSLEHPFKLRNPPHCASDVHALPVVPHCPRAHTPLLLLPLLLPPDPPLELPLVLPLPEPPLVELPLVPPLLLDPPLLEPLLPLVLPLLAPAPLEPPLFPPLPLPLVLVPLLPPLDVEPELPELPSLVLLESAPMPSPPSGSRALPVAHAPTYVRAVRAAAVTAVSKRNFMERVPR